MGDRNHMQTGFGDDPNKTTMFGDSIFGKLANRTMDQRLNLNNGASSFQGSGKLQKLSCCSKTDLNETQKNLSNFSNSVVPGIILAQSNNEAKPR